MRFSTTMQAVIIFISVSLAGGCATREFQRTSASTSKDGSGSHTLWSYKSSSPQLSGQVVDGLAGAVAQGANLAQDWLPPPWGTIAWLVGGLAGGWGIRRAVHVAQDKGYRQAATVYAPPPPAPPP